jgi:hypothetical protein
MLHGLPSSPQDHAEGARVSLDVFIICMIVIEEFPRSYPVRGDDNTPKEDSHG